MIYLRRYTVTDNDLIVEIAAVEDARRAAPYEARGFVRCTPEAFLAAWRLRDAQQAREREVGG